jgi:hypothetical protein
MDSDSQALDSGIPNPNLLRDVADARPFLAKAGGLGVPVPCKYLVLCKSINVFGSVG